jgi:hypothetical protein
VVGLGGGRSHGNWTSHIGVPKRYIDRIDPVDNECDLSSRPATNVLDSSCLREIPSKCIWASFCDERIVLGGCRDLRLKSEGNIDTGGILSSDTAAVISSTCMRIKPRFRNRMPGHRDPEDRAQISRHVHCRHNVRQAEVRTRMHPKLRSDDTCAETPHRTHVCVKYLPDADLGVTGLLLL